MKRRKIVVTDAFGRTKESLHDEQKLPQKRMRAYERYFSGYEVREVPMKYGGTKQVRVYVGDLFRQELPEKKCRLLRLIYLLLSLGSAGLFLGSLFLNVTSNFSIYILFCVLIPVICFIWLGSALLAYIPSGRDLKDHEYREGALRLVNACRITIGGIAFVMVATLAVFFLGVVPFAALELVRIGMMAAAIVLLLILARVEGKMKYIKIEGKSQTEENQQICEN